MEFSFKINFLILFNLQDDGAVFSNEENQIIHEYFETENINNHSENTKSWIDCVGKLSFLLQIVKKCKSLLKKVDNDDDIPNLIYF